MTYAISGASSTRFLLTDSSKKFFRSLFGAGRDLLSQLPKILHEIHVRKTPKNPLKRLQEPPFKLFLFNSFASLHARAQFDESILRVTWARSEKSFDGMHEMKLDQKK